MKAIVDEKHAWVRLGIKTVVIAFILWLLFGFFFGIQRVSSFAMNPYIMDGDLVFYSRLDRDFQVGEVVIYEHDGASHMARIAALSPEFVRADQNGFIFVNNEQLSNEPICNDNTEIATVNSASTQTGAGLFLINDNTDDANDSRTYGRISEDMIRGKVISVIRTRKP